MMTLADEIIYGITENIKHLIQSGVDVNEIDEYGFTPLIETVIVDRIEIAKLLLASHADVNKSDLTGRTALHWAVDVGSESFCKLLISEKANLNAYTLSGEPVLVNSLLRQDEELKMLLMKKGASLSFAQDFINTKLLGHRFELQGDVDIVDNKEQFIEIEFTGFFLEFTLQIVRDSLVRYQNNFSARHLRFYFDSIRRLITAFSVAAQLIKYQVHVMEAQKHQAEILSLLKQDLLLIPVCYTGHAITLIKYKNFLVKCDRGVNAQTEGSINVYRIHRPELMTSEFIMNLIYKPVQEEFVQRGINRILELELVAKLPVEPQITGNCSWANVDAAVCAMLFLLLAIDKNQNIEKSVDEAILFYCQWQSWDKDRALEECIQSFTYSSAARKASRATVLAAVLFQACQYGVPSDMARANKILSVLSSSMYLPVLQSYVDIFAKDPQAASLSPHGKNLTELLNYFDVDLYP